MKIFVKITAILLTLALIAAGFMLPELALDVANSKNAAVNTETLPPVTLNLREDFSLAQKIELASSYETVFSQKPKTLSNESDVRKAVVLFLMELTGSDDTQSLFPFVFDFIDAGLYRDAKGNGDIFWQVNIVATDFPFDMILLIDDQTLEVLTFEAYTPNEMSYAGIPADNVIISENLIKHYIASLGISVSCQQTECLYIDEDGIVYSEEDELFGERDYDQPIFQRYEITCISGGETYNFELVCTYCGVSFASDIYGFKNVFEEVPVKEYDL